MSLFDRLRGAARGAADFALRQPAVRRRVDAVKTAYDEARVLAEARFSRVESDLWAWINRIQAEAQRAGRQADRRRSSKDYYRLLGLEPGAGMSEVKSAYRKQMRAHHPDRFAHDPAAEAEAQNKAQAINEAYRELTALLTGREDRRSD